MDTQRRLMLVIAILMVISSVIYSVTIISITGAVTTLSGEVSFCRVGNMRLNAVPDIEGYVNARLLYKLNASSDCGEPLAFSATTIPQLPSFYINSSSVSIDFVPSSEQEGYYYISLFALKRGFPVNSTTFFLTIHPGSLPITDLINPADGYSNSTTGHIQLNFSCNATVSGLLSNISLYLTSSVNSSFSINETTTVSGGTSSASWLVNISAGQFTWNCLAKNNLDQMGWGTNRTMVISAVSSGTPGSSSSSSSSSGSSGGGGGSGGGSRIDDGEAPLEDERDTGTEERIGEEQQDVPGRIGDGDRREGGAESGDELARESEGADTAAGSGEHEPEDLVGGIMNMAGRAFSANVRMMGVDISVPYLVSIAILIATLTALLMRLRRANMSFKVKSTVRVGETLEINIKAHSGVDPGVFYAWTLLAPESGALLDNIRVLMQNAPTYKIGMEPHEIRKAVIPIYVPYECSPEVHRLVICTRWESLPAKGMSAKIDGWGEDADRGTNVYDPEDDESKRGNSREDGFQEEGYGEGIRKSKAILQGQEQTDQRQTDKNVVLRAYMYKVTVFRGRGRLIDTIKGLFNRQRELPGELAINMQKVRDKIGARTQVIEVARSHSEKIRIRQK